MTKYTDEEIARQLEELWNTIVKGTNRALELLERSRAVEAEVLEYRTIVENIVAGAETTKLEISEIAQQVEVSVETLWQLQVAVAEKVQTAEQFRNEIISSVAEIGGIEILSALKEEISSARTRLIEAKMQLEQAEELLQGLEMRSQEVATQIESNKNTVFQLAQKTADKANEVLQVRSDIVQLQEDIWSEVQQNEIRIEQRYSIFEVQLQANLTATEQRIEAFQQEVANAIDRLNSTLTTVNNEMEGKIAEVKTELIRSQINQIETLVTQARSQEEGAIIQLSKKLEIIEKRQKYFRNWLLGVTFGVGLALAIAIALLRLR
ncbi:hypothetical protein H6F77_16305 [Microcoleus sp. FACHB-831]|uniref:hypothetical protein n=1 Tax=Microcoleus sp. FACHB-831 TaxID=2692827 RepID=UPI0016884BAB|nr:hypothetical protein [Microcoleus sp. FACHB-831]MBD1922625.1 hypothetical protein [Microcoleus sp. FACHB-831]